MKEHSCIDHLDYPHHDPPIPVYIPGRGYEERWVSVCTVCGRRFQVTRETTYRFSLVYGQESGG